jgi:hypothetical protein
MGKTFNYHFYAMDQSLPGCITHVDGVARLPVLLATGDDYLALKVLISETYELADPLKLVICSLTLLSGG